MNKIKNNEWPSKRVVHSLKESVRHTHLRGMLGMFVGVMGFTSAAYSASSLTTTTAYDYELTSGMLTKEVIEPANSSLCVVTAYGLDAYGHHQTTTARNCNGSAGNVSGAVAEAATPAAPAAFATRVHTNSYSTDKRFIATRNDTVNQNQSITSSETYDGRFGAQNSQTDPNGLVTNWAYDTLGRKVLEQRPDGNGTQWTYNYCIVGSNGGSLSCPTINGVAGAYAVTSVPVAAPINLTAQTTGAVNGPYVRVYYDVLGREIRTETQGFDGTPIYQDTQYTYHRDLVSAKSLPYYAGQTAYWTTYTYDTMDRIVSTIQPNDTGSGNLTTTTSIIYSGLTTTVNDPRGTTTTLKNVVGQVATITDANGGALNNTYDPNGNLVQTQDAKGNILSMVYDPRGRKTDQYDPDMGIWHYSYDALSELMIQTNAKGQVTTFGYDQLGRMTSRSEPSLNSNWSYDQSQYGIGKLSAATAANDYMRNNYYDSLGRIIMTAVTGVGGSTTKYFNTTYDANGHIASQTYPTGLVINNSYTSLGFLKQVIDNRTGGALWIANSKDALGHVTQYTYGNGITTTNQYYPSTGRLQVTRAGPSNAVQNLSQSYDSVGRLSSRIDGLDGVTSQYTYDSINRLTNESRSVGSTSTAQTLAWGYDAIGNMLTRTENGITSTYNYNTSGSGSILPHAVANVSGYVDNTVVPVYGYDTNGNIVSGAGRTITWNSFDKAQGIVEGGKDLEYLYDADHERAKETYSLYGALQRTTIYLNPAAGAGLSYEEDSGVAGSQQRHYISAGGMTVGVITCTASPCTNTANTTTQYWHQDHQGSNSVVTDASGNVIERLAYEPFGKRRNSNGLTDVNGTLQPVNTHRGFTEHEHLDEVALINMNGRVYDPALGRFLSADPTIQAPYNLQSYNRYTYTWNDPLNNTDPSGYDLSEGGWVEPNYDNGPTLSPSSMGAMDNTTYNSSNPYNGSNTSLMNPGFDNIGIFSNLSNASSISQDFGIGAAMSQNYWTTPGNDPTGSISDATQSNFNTSQGGSSIRDLSVAGLTSRVWDRMKETWSWRDVGKNVLFAATLMLPAPPVAQELELAADSAAGGASAFLKGQAGVERSVLAAEARGETVLGREITIETASGTRTRPDLLVRDTNGNLKFIECKNGPCASLTPNQRTGFPEIQQSGGIPRGGNAANAGLTPGQPIGPTPVQIDWWNR